MFMSALVYLHRISTFLLHKKHTPTDFNMLLYFLMNQLDRTFGKTFNPKTDTPPLVFGKGIFLREGETLVFCDF